MDLFLASMPAAYGRLYGAREVAEHAAIVARRGPRPVHAELWQSAEGRVYAWLPRIAPDCSHS